MVYAFGTWYLFDYAKGINIPVIRHLASATLGIAILVFFFMNALLAVTFNSNLNLRHKYSIDPFFSTYLEEHLAPDEKVSLNGILVRTIGGAHLFFSRRVSPLNAHPQYVALIDESGIQIDYQSHSRMRAFARRITDLIGLSIDSHLEAATAHPPENYSLEKTFGVVKIYHRNP
jgi:hypothetical protein